MEIVYFLLIGGVAGWLAGKIMKGRGFGILGNVVVGVVGAFIGGFVLRLLGLVAADGSLIGNLVVALVGAIVLLALAGALKKA